MSRAPVNFLSPVLPDASQALGNTAQNLNEAANRDVQRADIAARVHLGKAQLDAQQKIAEAQLKSTEGEHAKYQDFLKGQQTEELQARAQQEEAQRQHDTAMLQEREQFDSAQNDKANRLRLQLDQVNLDYLTTVGRQQEELQAKRAPLREQLSKITAAQAAADQIINKSPEEVRAAAVGMTEHAEAFSKSIDAADSYAQATAPAVVKNILAGYTRQKAAGGTGMYLSDMGEYISTDSRGKTPTQVAKGQASVMLGKAIANETSKAIENEMVTGPFGLAQEDRKTVSSAIMRMLDIASQAEGQGDAYKGSLKQEALDLGGRLKGMIEKDPAKAYQMQLLIEHLGSEFKRIADTSDVKGLAEAAGEKGGKYNEGEYEAIRDTFRKLSDLPTVWRLTGVRAPSRAELGMATAMLKTHAMQGAPQEKLAQAVLELPESMRKAVMGMYASAAPAIAAKQKETEAFKERERLRKEEEALNFRAQDLESAQTGAPFAEALGVKKKGLSILEQSLQ